MDLGRFERLGRREGGQDAGEASGEQGLPGSGWTLEKEVMPSGGGDLQCAARLRLSAYGGEVWQALVFRSEVDGAFGPCREAGFADQMPPDVSKRPRGMERDIRDERGLVAVFFRHDELGGAGASGEDGGRKRAAGAA
jgi:hypothetical protein